LPNEFNLSAKTDRPRPEAAVLYDVVWLMAGPDLERALTSVADRLRTELNLAAVLKEEGRHAGPPELIGGRCHTWPDHS
jgi:hypothetical protein